MLSEYLIRNGKNTVAVYHVANQLFCCSTVSGDVRPRLAKQVVVPIRLANGTFSRFFIRSHGNGYFYQKALVQNVQGHICRAVHIHLGGVSAILQCHRFSGAVTPVCR